MDCNDGNIKGFVGYKYPPTVAAGRECGVTTHAVSRNAGYGLLVLKSYDHIDQAQAEKFTRAIGSHNSRPVQPLNARVVIE